MHIGGIGGEKYDSNRERNAREYQAKNDRNRGRASRWSCHNKNYRVVYIAERGRKAPLPLP